MAVPENKIKKVTIPSGTTYDIVPEILSDGTYSAGLPSLSSDATLVTEEGTQTISGEKTFNANTTYAFNTHTYLGNTTNSYIFNSSNPSIKLTNNSTTTRYTLLSVSSLVVHYSNTDITTYSNSIKHNNNGTVYTYNFPQYNGTLAVVSASDSSSITINGTQIPLSGGGGSSYNHYITLHANNDNGPDEGCDVVFNVITSDNTAITTDTALINAIKTGVIVVKSASNYYYNSSFEKQTQIITPQNLNIAIGPWSSEPYDFDCIQLTLLNGSSFSTGESSTAVKLSISSSASSSTTDYNNVTISDTVQQTVVLPETSSGGGSLVTTKYASEFDLDIDSWNQSSNLSANFYVTNNTGSSFNLNNVSALLTELQSETGALIFNALEIDGTDVLDKLTSYAIESDSNYGITNGLHLYFSQSVSGYSDVWIYSSIVGGVGSIYGDVKDFAGAGYITSNHLIVEGQAYAPKIANTSGGSSTSVSFDSSTNTLSIN